MASVANTYARAFADVVFSAHLDAVRAIGGLQSIASLYAESADLRRVWENPAVPADQKRRLLDAIVQREGIDKPVRNLVAVLMDHRRLPYLGRIVEQLEKELDARLGFAEAQTPKSRRSRLRSGRRPARRSAQATDLTHPCWAERWSASAARFTTVR
ncbi:MAG: F0F1 ATP synthase subunit delta [Candidatus Sulfotelmatobacter sp.]